MLSRKIASESGSYGSHAKTRISLLGIHNLTKINVYGKNKLISSRLNLKAALRSFAKPYPAHICPETAQQVNIDSHTGDPGKNLKNNKNKIQTDSCLSAQQGEEIS